MECHNSFCFYPHFHSRPQSPRSFWPVAGIEGEGFEGRLCLVQHQKSGIHGLPVNSSKSDWLRMRNEYSAHAQKIGSGQISRSHSRPQRPRSFWSAPRIDQKERGLWERECLDPCHRLEGPLL